jgi:predicted nucleic acid-binding protein
MGRIYLDTSVISALFDTRTPERMSQTQAAWSEVIKHEVFISTTVINELSNATDRLRVKFLDAVSAFKVLKITPEATVLAKEYVNRGIFPAKYLDDAIHVAIAATNGIGILLSWNFTHLVKVKTRRFVALVNAENDYSSVEIISPPEL